MTYQTTKPNKFKRMRRWLGIDDQQEVIAGLIQEIEELRGELDGIQFFAGAEEARHDSLRREVEELGRQATKTKNALGGAYWTTASGFTRPIALLSDTHLQALIDGGYAKGSLLNAVRDEQQRREEDDDWADRQGRGSLRNRVQRLEEVTPVPTAQQRRNIERMKEQSTVEGLREITFQRMYTNVDFAKMERRALLDAMVRNMEMVRDLLAEEDC